MRQTTATVSNNLIGREFKEATSAWSRRTPDAMVGRGGYGTVQCSTEPFLIEDGKTQAPTPTLHGVHQILESQGPSVAATKAANDGGAE